MKITANMVTFARMAFLPIPCIMFMSSEAWVVWVAFFLYVFLGATDFIDGLLARRDGPTKLGGLIDPVADKIFVASVLLAACAAHIFPAWFVLAVLSRELLVTALRSSAALRKAAIKTSTLAKVKTIFQMGGFGTIFLTLNLTQMVSFLCSLVFAAFCGSVWAYYHFVFRQKSPMWVLPVFGAFVLWACLHVLSVEWSAFAQLVVIAGLTWISALDYLGTCWKLYRHTGIERAELARIAWVVSFGVCVAPFVGIFPSTVLIILLAISFEFALGGVDNVVAAEKEYVGIAPFLTTSIAAFVTYLCLVGHRLRIVEIHPVFITSLLAIVSGVSFIVTFMKWRKLFRRAFEA